MNKTTLYNFIFYRKNRNLETENRYITKYYFFTYTVVFCITFAVTFVWYWGARKSFIYSGDPWNEHFKALIYGAKYLRQILRNLIFQHKLIIPEFDFNIGLGADIFESICVHDSIISPFFALAVLVPTKYMVYYYGFIIFAKIYLSGLFFSCLCFYTGRRNTIAVLAGALTYSFSYWIFANTYHPPFLLPPLFLPLVILGLEKIFNGDSPTIYIASIFLVCVSYFYCFYMMSIVVFIYSIARALITYKKDYRKILNKAAAVIASSLLGVSMAAVVFLPMAYIFLHNSRTGVDFGLHLFYPFRYYARFPAMFITINGMKWTRMGYSIPTLLAVFLLFKQKKEYTLLKTLFITCIIMLCFPIFGKIFNGMGYVTNRWSWAVAPVAAYILVAMYSNLSCLKHDDFFYLLKCMSIICVFCFLSQPARNLRTFIILLLGVLLLATLVPTTENEVKKWYLSPRSKEKFVFICVLISIFCNSFFLNSAADGADNFSKTAYTYDDVRKSIFNTEAQAVLKAAKDENPNYFFRYSGINLADNAGMLEGLSSLSYYWSLQNQNLIRYRKDMASVITGETMHHKSDDDNTVLATLDSVLYYSIPKKNEIPAPFGFSHIKNYGNYKIYRNDNFLPFGYTYDTYVSAEERNVLSPVEKQETMLYAAFIDETQLNNAKNYKRLKKIPTATQKIQYKLVCDGKGISLQNGNTFVVTAANATAALTFDGIPNSETYFCIRNIWFSGAPTKKMYWIPPDTGTLKIVTSSNITKNIYYRTPDYQFYAGIHDFSVNLNYSEKPVTSVSITFPTRGIYTFDSIDIYCMPFDNYPEKIKKLKQDTLQNVKFENGKVSGNISLSTPKILCLSIPYSDGWKAYVNGKETRLLKANVAYMALELDVGEHDIELRYKRPWQKIGIVVSVVAILIFIIFLIYRKNLEKKHNT